jgi:ABC-type multidrug transport system permease subunit
LIIGSVFYDITDSTNGFFSRGGVLFFAILFNSLAAMSEIPALYSQRPILVRQRRYKMAHPAVDAIAQTVVDLPVRGFVVIVFDVILYWMTGMAASAAQFFIFLLITIVTCCKLLAWYLSRLIRGQC